MPNVPTHPRSLATTPGPAGCAVGWEQLEWTGDAASPGAMSHRAQKKARGPYRAAIPARIAALHLNLPAAVAVAAEDALMEITRFDAELATALPAPDGGTDGELAPLAAVLLRTESASSSQIENVTAGAKALALATAGERTGPNAQMVAANVAAMQAASAMAEKLSVDSILAAHSALMAGQDRLSPGRFRTAPVWIGAGAPTPHTASFVPPSAERIDGAMEDLLTYCARTDVPALPQAAIAHAQFETIHPFADGNGRTGRILVHALLHAAGATRRMTVPVSAGLLTDTASYFQALTAYRDGDPAPIVGRFTDAALSGVTHGRILVEELTGAYRRWQGAVTARRDAAVWRVLPMLIRQPAVTVRWVQDHAHVSQPAAQRAIDQLLAAGVLTPASANRRNRVWIAEDVITALDDFAARLGRRA